MSAERSPAEAVYRLLTRLYPRGFRAANGDDLVAWFREHRRMVSSDGRAFPALRLWARIGPDFLISVVREHLAALRAPRVPSHQRGGRGTALRDLLSETRIAVRGYLRRPLFTMVAVSTLAVGIGATTTIYSVIESVLLKPLPYDDVEQLYRVGHTSDNAPERIYAMSYLDFRDLEAANQSFEALAASRLTRVTLLGGDVPESRLAALVTPQFFDALRVQPAMGRVFTREEYLAEESLLVISHEYWSSGFDQAPDVLGQTVVMEGRPSTVIGVLPEDFLPPEALSQTRASVWAPLSLYSAEARGNRADGFIAGIGRLRPGVTAGVARAELDVLGEGIRNRFPEESGRHFFGIDSLLRQTVGSVGETFVPLIGAVALLLLIACGNVANLLLVRASERERELAVRAAIGAGRGQIVRQLLLESLVLATVGGLLGVGLARFGTDLFVRLNPGDIPRLSEVSLSASAVVVALLISGLTAIVFGLAPALLASRRVGKGSIGSGAARGGRAVGASRMWNGLIAVESALALVMVMGAGLLINSFVRMNRVDAGFDVTDVYAMTVIIPGEPTMEESADFFGRVLERVEAIPGVLRAGGTDMLPLSDGSSWQAPAFDGVDIPADENGDGFSSRYQRVTAGFFETMDVELIQGRQFNATDVAGAPLVAVVNEALVRTVFGEMDPIGERFSLGDNGLTQGSFEIVGVVRDARSYNLVMAPEPEIFFSSPQVSPGYQHLLAEVAPGQAGVLQAMREALAEVRADVPALSPRALIDFRASSIAGPRFYASLLGGLAGVALLLALVGVYGTLSYVFARRAREMGVRKALGASGDSLLALMIRCGMIPVLIGVIAGVAIALPATRVLQSFVFEIEPTDPATLAITCLAILFTALIATLVPALRATRLDPMSVLREE